MFIQPCFIQKCTPALIEKLVELGYKIMGKTTLSYGIFCNNGKIKICSTNEQPSIKDKNFIQCYDNEELFLALAALRDETDKKQWFISNVDIFTECYNNEWRLYENWHNIFTIEDLNSKIPPIRKATVKEIIEHFKDR